MKKIYIAPITEEVKFASGNLLESAISVAITGNAAGDDPTNAGEPGTIEDAVGTIDPNTNSTYVPDAKQGRWDLWDDEWDY